MKSMKMKAALKYRRRGHMAKVAFGFSALRVSKCLILLALVSGVFSTPPAILGVDLKPEEVISRHLESIATESKRQGLKTLFGVGLSRFLSRMPIIEGGGKAI